MTDNENIGVKLEVPCNTWEQEVAEKYFGVGCELKITEAEVTRVVKPASHHPTFSLRFPARKATFSGYSLQDVFRHATEYIQQSSKVARLLFDKPKIYERCCQ